MVPGETGHVTDDILTNKKEAESASFYIGVTY